MDLLIFVRIIRKKRKASLKILQSLKEQGKLEEAIEVFNKALDIKPDYADTYFKASFVYNLRGEIQKGLEFYEWRLINKDTKSRPPRERLFWNGFESIEGKKFFVFGDTFYCIVPNNLGYQYHKMFAAGLPCTEADLSCRKVGG